MSRLKILGASGFVKARCNWPVVFLVLCVFVQACQSRHPVPTYFHRLNPNGSVLSVTSSEYHLKITSYDNNKLSTETETLNSATLKASPDVIFNKEKEVVSVTWAGVSEASWQDFVGFYCPPTDAVTRYLDYIPVNEAGPGYEAGHGGFKVTVYNMRVPCEFRYYKYKGEHAQLVVKSNVVRFSGGSSTPLQGHLSLAGNPTEMKVMWMSGSDSPPFVRYGVNKSLTWLREGSSRTYQAKDLCGFPADSIGFRDPGYIHNVLLTGLKPSTFYHYQFGSKEKMSEVFNFTTPPIPDPDFSFKFLAYGDMGLSLWYGAHDTASLSLEEVKNGAKVVLHIGDISYARGWAYIWDQWHALIEPYATLVPYMVGIGNHEQDHTSGGSKDPSGAPGEGFHPSWGNYGDDSGGECGVPMYYRFDMPHNGNGIWWYSFDYGSVHFIMMSTEHNFTRGSRQYKWLEHDLATVDRHTTPWLVLTGHRPMYTSQETLEFRDPVIAQHLRMELEDLLYEYKVDLTLWGHYHSYERTHPVYREKPTAGAPTYIIVGTAGFILEPYPWPEPSREWSAYHAVHYGYGRVTVANRSALLWEWVRNSDKRVTDSVWLYK